MDMRVLVIDDDRRIREMLRRNLVADGYLVDVAADGESGLRRLRETEPDLLVLDVNMPGMSGFEVCRVVRRERRGVPVLLLTARGEVGDRVAGLDAGADDYLPKPFAYEELAARIRALVRRAHPEADEVIRFADLVVDPQARSCRRGERQIDLSPREFDLLELLARNARTALERWKIIEQVWEDEIDIDSNALEVYVGYLRRKLEAAGEPRLVQTVRGVGYMLREPR